jgi:hypothetical protein
MPNYLFYLLEMGKRLDCYFTVENVGHADTMERSPNGELIKRGHPGNQILEARVNVDSGDVKDIDAMVSFLNKVSIEWKDYEPRTIHLLADKIERNKTIIRIRDAKLSEVDDYVLNKKVSIEYDGDPLGLIKLLSTQGLLIEPQIGGTRFGRPGGIDNGTPIKVSVKDKSIRDMFTECIPLAGYSRLIWSSYTAGTAKSPVVTVSFYGLSK